MAQGDNITAAEEVGGLRNLPPSGGEARMPTESPLRPAAPGNDVASAKRRPDGATPAQLKSDIDAGRTGDKVGGLDPAAAPLGSDAEAGGVPASPGVVARAREQEGGGAPESRTANAATPELAPDARLKHPASRFGPTVAGVVAGGAVAAVIWLLL